MLLYILGVADDLVGVSYRYKFVVQIMTAALLAFTGDWISSLGGLFGIHDISPWMGMPFTVLVIVNITNAINLIDGLAAFIVWLVWETRHALPENEAD